MTKDDIMTRDEIDTMWQQALCAAVADGEMFTRYRFSALLEAKVRADERNACAALCSEVAAGRDAEAIEEAILARVEK